MDKRFDISGKIYNQLTVIKFHSKDKTNNYVWECLCSCGNTTYVRSRDLKNGHTKACGCLKIAHNRKQYGESSFNKLYSRYKREAKLNNRVFELSKDDFRSITSNKCYYCGCYPTLKVTSERSYGTYLYNGIDRINNDIGYTLTNVRTSCRTCNFMKGFMSEELFISKIKEIHSNLYES